jgi:adenine-specific DNA-methyltransferase
MAENRIWWGKDGSNEVPALKLFLSDTRDGLIPHNWWPHQEVSHTDEAKKSLDKLFGGVAPFDTPKPIKLILRMIQISGIKGGEVFLDFFAGSAASGEAAFRFETEDGKSLKTILVQLPEPCEAGSEAAKQGYRNIAEVTKERLRRAGALIKAETPQFIGDTGFRVFKLASSNIRAWEPDATDLEKSLLKNAEHLIQGRNEQDVLYELLLKLGLDLCVPFETKTIARKAVHSIGGGALIVCLSEGLTKEVIEPLSAGIVAWREKLAPSVDTRVVFKDSGFADDIAKTNMAAILNQNGISDVRSL